MHRATGTGWRRALVLLFGLPLRCRAVDSPFTTRPRQPSSMIPTQASLLAQRFVCLMKLSIATMGLLLLSAAIAGRVSAQQPSKGPSRLFSNNGQTAERAAGPKFHASRILVRYKDGTSRQTMMAVHAAAGAQLVRELTIVKGLHAAEIGAGRTIEETLQSYRKDPNVLYAEPDYYVHIVAAPNDPQFSTQWSLQNTGQSGGTVGADIHAVQAWSLSTGSSNVVVGVLDTGVDYNHPDLAANIWSSANGFTATTMFGAQVQCAAGTHGFNMVAQTCDPLDDNGHGTHVSGTIGAQGNNGVGVAGVNWRVQILPCKFLDVNGGGFTEAAIACLGLMKQLKDSGVNIVVTNNSWGGSDSSQALHDAIVSAMQDGILFVAAAGNDFSNNDLFPTYPANFFVPNVISVAATDRTDTVVTFSNTGRRTVHIAAPGRDILSTLPNASYGLYSGTSMATPHVTGVAALLKAQNPNLDWRAIKNLILSGGDANATAQQTLTQKRLNAFGAMTCSNATFAGRVAPVGQIISASVGSPVTLAFENVKCAQPAGNVSATITPGNLTVPLLDDGNGADLAAGDGIYSAQWTPSQAGTYTAAFSDGTSVSIEVLTGYGVTQAPFNYRTIGGTNLNLGDDAVATITAPFTIPFGGGVFTKLFVSSNGTISLTEPFDVAQNFGLQPNQIPNYYALPNTLIAPMWQDLYPVKGTNQNVFWAVTGSAPNRELVVEWRNVLAFACRSDATTGVTFQVVFKENSSDVLFNYNDVVFGGNCFNYDYGQLASTGILTSPAQGLNWNIASQPALANGLALLWQSPPATGPNNAVPTLTSLSPNSVPIFSPDTILTLTGTNFVPGSTVGLLPTNIVPVPPPVNLPTAYISSTQLTAILPAEFAAPNNRYSVGGTPAVVVSNPGPGSPRSNSLSLTFAYPGVPSITSLTPNTAAAGDFSFYMDVKGNNLLAVTINWNGSPLQTFGISNTEVYASVPSGLLTAPKNISVTAVPGFGNTGPSAPAAFTITQPAPFALPALGPASSPALQGAGVAHETMNSDGTAPSGKKLHKPVRFLGWNYGQKYGGPVYFKHFSRRYGSAPISPAAAPSATGSAATSASPQSVSLSQPSSLPGFAFHPTLPAGFIPTSVATADFNRDEKMDWIISNGGSNDLWIYFGKGDGTAQLPKIVRLTGAGPIQVVAADLRKNGITDLVVAEPDSQTIGVLLGNGDGTFQPETTYFVPGPPLCVAVADINNDGKPDIVAGIIGTPQQGPIATFLGDGTGKFGAPITTPGHNPIVPYLTVRLVMQDLNKDGLPDIALIDEGLPTEEGGHTYLNNGDGTFKHADYFVEADPVFPTDLAIADMDGDGCPDIVTVEMGGTASIFHGTCDGNVQGFPNVKGLGAGEAPISVRIADMNGDTKLDIVAGGGAFGIDPLFGEEASNLVTVLLGDGTGNFATPQVYRAEPALVGLALVDLNGDNKPEVIAASQTTDTAIILLNNGQGKLDGPSGHYAGYLTEGQFGASNAPFSSFLVQDLNGDGKPDLAFIGSPQTFSSPWQLLTMLNDGTGHFSNTMRQSIADFDFGASGVPSPSSYIFADLHGSGKPDLVLTADSYQGSPNTSLIVVPNNGDGSFGHAKVTALNATQLAALTMLASGDFNHDGKLDIVGMGLTPQPAPGQPGTMELAFFAGNGDGTFQTPKLTPLGNTGTGGPAMIFAGDYNHDGKLDLLIWTNANVAPFSDRNVYEFLGNGDGTFSAPLKILANIGPFGMADLNHDGSPDIVSFDFLPSPQLNGFYLPSYTVYLGQPNGSFTKSQTYAPYSGIVAQGFGFSNVGPSQGLTPMLADFNGDGNIDLGVMMFTPDANTGSYMQVLASNGDGTFTPTYEITRFDKMGLPTNAADVTGDGRADLLELDGWPASFNMIQAATGQAVQLAFASQPIVGTKGTVVVNLSLPASSATTIQLSASDANISIPATATVTAGSLSAAVPFTIGGSFDSSKVFSITGQLSGTSSTIYSYQAPSGLAGFRLSANSQQQMTPPGGTTQDFGLILTSIGGYSGTAQFSCQGLPAGATCVFGTNPSLIVPGQSSGIGLTIQTATTTALGSYKITVAATDGAITDKLTVTLKVADFSVSLAPTSSTLLSGGSVDYSLGLASSSGWSDMLTLSCSVTGPATQIGCDAAGPTSLSSSIPFTVSTAGFAAGDYTVSVSASADGVSHSASAVIHVQGAQGTLSPGNATAVVGGTATFNVSLASQNGLTDQFSFSCIGLPAGLSCAFNPPSGTLPANGSLASVLTVTVNSRPAFAPILDEPRYPAPGGRPVVWIYLLVAAGFALFARCSRNLLRSFAGRLSIAASCASAALLLALAMAACGGGSTSPPPPPPPPPPVNVTITVQASSPSLSVVVGNANLQVK